MSLGGNQIVVLGSSSIEAVFRVGYSRSGFFTSASSQHRKMRKKGLSFGEKSGMMEKFLIPPGD